MIRMRYRRGFADSTESPTRTEVRSPTRTSTSTKASTTGNVTVTGGAGSGNTTVYIPDSRTDEGFFTKYKTPILIFSGIAVLFGAVAVASNSRRRKRRR